MSETLEEFKGDLISQIAKVHQNSRVETILEGLGRDIKSMQSDLHELNSHKVDDAVWRATQEQRLIAGNKKFELIEKNISKLEEIKLDKKTVFFVAVGFLIANGGITAAIAKMFLV